MTALPPTIDSSIIQTLLEQWGRYCRQVAPPNLGYPRRAAYTPPTPSPGAPIGMGESDEQQARHLDRILAGLKQQDRAAYRVLEQIYLWRISAVEAAARVGMSRTVFYGARARGEAFVAGALSAPTEMAA